MARWYVFEVKRPGKRPEFIGRALTTTAAIHENLGPHYAILGNLVTIYGRPSVRRA